MQKFKIIIVLLVITILCAVDVAFAVNTYEYSVNKYADGYNETATRNYMIMSAQGNSEYAATSANNNYSSGTHALRASVNEYFKSYPNGATVSATSTRIISAAYADSVSSGTVSRVKNDKRRSYVHTSTLYATSNTSIASETNAMYRIVLKVSQE